MRMLPVVSNRESICLSCREKRCCSYYTVTVTTHDMVRIASTMQLAPSDFLTYYTVAADEKGGFLLRPGGAKHALALVKRQLPDETASPCIFLLRTNDQHGVCALGELRPAQCRTFPTYLTGGVVAVAPRPAGCVRGWSFADIDVTDELRGLLRAHAEDTAHNDLVARWNERVHADGYERGFEEFCAFLINHVEQLEVSA